MALTRSSSPSPAPTKRPRKGFARRCERCCWTFVTHMPLAFVYGLATWAVFVEVSLSRIWILSSWRGYISMLIGVALYILLNWSYTTAVFTDPGSPLAPPSSSASKAGYSHLPMHEPAANPDLPSFTVKSTGGTRYCKKCQARKPDRAHHCSTCRRCVLKMDHHCPWLATCVGLRNYKPFLLFCSYTTLFCWVCFGVSATALWTEISNDARFDEGFLPVNMVLLAVLAGIMGVVLAGFTGWHLHLAWRGQTTIECLENTRYLGPLRKSMQRAQLGGSDENEGLMQRYGQQLAEIHANAIPGVTRLEEGEERPSPVGDLEQGLSLQEAVHMDYDERERVRERQRYEDYLDEKDSEQLPNAFDLGWKRNLNHLFGDKPLFWLLPICNTQGDGWHWEPSTRWLEARDEIRRKREAQWKEQEEREVRAGWGENRIQIVQPPRANFNSERRYLSTSNGVVTVPGSGRRSPGKADQILGRTRDQYADGGFEDHRPGSGMSMKTLRRKGSFEREESKDHFEVSSDEEDRERGGGRRSTQRQNASYGGPSTRVDGGEEDWREWD